MCALSPSRAFKMSLWHEKERWTRDAPTYWPCDARESTQMITPPWKMKPSVVVPCSILIALGAASPANASRRNALG